MAKIRFSQILDSERRDEKRAPLKTRAGEATLHPAWRNHGSQGMKERYRAILVTFFEVVVEVVAWLVA